MGTDVDAEPSPELEPEPPTEFDVPPAGEDAPRRQGLPQAVTARVPLLLMSAVTTVGVLVAGASPTGSILTDAFVLAPLITLAIWVGRRAPWWWVVTAGLVAFVPLAVGAPRPVAIMFGLLTVALALTRSERRDGASDDSVVPMVAIASLIMALASLGNVASFGVSAAIACGVIVVTIVLGVHGRADDAAFVRRALLIGGVAVSVAVAVAALFGWWARSDLLAARESIDTGVQQAKNADVAAAGESVGAAHDRFDSAHLKLNNPLVWPARLVPVVAQNLAAADRVATAGGELTGAVTDTIDLAIGDDDHPGVRISNGTVDLDALRELADSTGRLADQLDRTAQSADQARSPWLAPQLDDALVSASETARRQRPVVTRYADAAQLLPDFLGADGERHYFVMFTTPAEARGTGGFMGNFAEISIDEGRISLRRFGRVNDLEKSMDDFVRLENAPPDWLARYGGYGFVRGEVGGVAPDAWAIINLSAQFPSTAQVAAELYAHSDGPAVDGVFSIDVYGLEALVDLVGPIEVDGGPTLTGDNTAEFLLLDQYLIGDGSSNAPRVDMLATIADEVLNRLLTDKPPGAAALAANLGPPARERRLLAWSRRDDEQEFFADIGVSGAVLDPHERKSGDDTLRPAFQVVLNNGTGSKIDSFLKRKITVDGTSVTVTLTNEAPSSGLPDYVIGTANDLDLQRGTNVTNLTVYSSDALTDFTLDGESVTPPDGTEADYFTYDMRFAIGPGETTTLTFETAEPNNLSIPQPLARTVDD